MRAEFSCILAVSLALVSPGQSAAMGLGGGGGGGTTTSSIVGQLGSFQLASRVDLTDSGELYVVDRTRGVVLWYGIDGALSGLLQGPEVPQGVAAYESEYTYCATPAGKSHKCRTTGKGAVGWVTEDVVYTFVSDLSDGSVWIFRDRTAVGQLGSGAGEFTAPNGITVVDDQVYVVDTGAHEVGVYDLDGTAVTSMGTHGSADGELDHPTDVAVDGDAGEVYVSDYRNGRVVVFDTSGTWLSNLSAPSNSAGDPAFYRPGGLGLDPDGYLYVVDPGLQAVVRMDTSGTLAEIFGYQSGAYWTGELSLPIDAASDGTHVYVSSSGEGRVNVFEVTP